MKDDIAKGRKPIGQGTIFYDMLTNNEVRPEEKGTTHLKTEAHVVVAAG